MSISSVDRANRPGLRTMWRRLAVAVLLLCGVALAAPQAHALAAGDKVSGTVSLGAKQIPLPAGNWVVAGLGTQAFRMPAIGAFGTIQSAVLLLTRGDTVMSVLEINGNSIPVNDGWGRTKGCNPDQGQLLLIQRYRTGWETSCQFVRPTRFSLDTPGPDAWEKARDFARKAKLTGPQVWLTSGFRVSDRQDILDVRYHVNPAMLLGSPALALNQVTDWSPDAVRQDPLRQGAVQAVSAWASGFSAWVDRGLRNQITEMAGPLPELAVSPPTYPDLKLADLKRLLNEGRITRQSYDEQVEKAKTEIPEYKPNTSLLSNSVQKNISFRSFGTIVDYGIAYVVTASNYISWGIALTLNATNSVWFVLNDRSWDNYYAKLNTHDSERMVDFSYIGEEARV